MTSISDKLDTPEVKLGPWEPPSEYNKPSLAGGGGVRTAEHDVLSGQTVVQSLGEEAEQFTMRGEGYRDDIKQLRDLKGEVYRLIHEVYSGYVLVSDVSFDPTNSWERDGDQTNWVYTYTVELIAA